MGDTTKIPLISSEVAGIWNSYIGDSMLICMYKYFINSAEDRETKAILQHSLGISNQHIELLTNILNQQRLPIPDGFRDKDVIINAPRLFSDAFYLQYIGYASRVAMYNYTLILNHIARSDIRAFFSKCISEYIDLYNRSTDLRLSKGIFIRAPQIEVPKNVEYVRNGNYMVNMLGKKSPLLAVEITHIFSLILGSITRKTLLIGFGQVCKDKKIHEYILRVNSMATKHNSIFTEILTDEGIPTPSPSDSYVTASTIAPFSEKLMLNKVMIMCSEKISSLGMAIADTRRSDLLVIYSKFLDEVMKNSKDCVDIMIKNGWLEQPPQAIKHENLVGV